MKPLPGNPQQSLRGQAVKLLARREHSRSELTEKLSALGTLEEINTVLDQLEQAGLLSDARVAANYVRGHAARFGAVKLKHVLRSRGISGELILASLAQEGIGDELQRARELWRRKFTGKPGCLPDRRDLARQARYLQSHGFSTEIIRKLITALDDE